MPQDPSQDPDFMKASTSDQMAYLRATDKDFAAASPPDQLSYLMYVNGQKIGPNPGAPPTANPSSDRYYAGAPPAPNGYQYSTGYAGQSDAPRDSGGFIDRLTTQAGRALQNPSNFLPSWKSLFPPLQAFEQAKQELQAYQNPQPNQDPAKTLGNMAPAALSALVTHAADAIPNPVKAAPEVVPQTPVWGQNSAASELQAVKRLANQSSGNRLSVEKSTPGAPTNTTTPSDAELAANTQRMLELWKSQKAQPPKIQTPEQGALQNIQDQAWQESVFGAKPQGAQDIGAQVRNANPEPTRAEVAQGQLIAAGKTAKAVGPAYGPNSPPMEAAQSSTIDLHGYKPESRTMTVQFKNGNVYELQGVPQEIWNNYKNSESQGSYYQQNLKGRYETRLVGKVGKKS